MKSCQRSILVVLFAAGSAFLAQSAFACGPDSPGVATALTSKTTSPLSEPTQNAKAKTEDRTVLLQLTLSHRGFVREVKVVQGPADLTDAAIKAAKKRNFKHHDTWGEPDSQTIDVAVTYPHGENAKPEIRQAMVGGVPGCIYLPARIRVASQVMESYVAQRVEPSYPAGAPNDLVFLAVGIVIGKDGNIVKAWKLSGPDDLISPAIDAVKQWKYKPYLLNGESTEVETTVWLKFPQTISIPPLPASD
jgi:Gram-negative bacterial TonB protein C-terminal